MNLAFRRFLRAYSLCFGITSPIAAIASISTRAPFPGNFATWIQVLAGKLRTNAKTTEKPKFICWQFDKTN